MAGRRMEVYFSECCFFMWQNGDAGVFTNEHCLERRLPDSQDLSSHVPIVHLVIPVAQWQCQVKVTEHSHIGDAASSFCYIHRHFQKSHNSSAALVSSAYVSSASFTHQLRGNIL